MDIPVSFRENGFLFPGRKRAMACTFQAGWPEAKTKKQLDTKNKMMKVVLAASCQVEDSILYHITYKLYYMYI